MNLSAANTYDEDGWLRIGICQPSIGEPYISTGSLYLASEAFLPLAYPPDAPFWREPNPSWTAQQAWAGQDLANDKACY